MDLEETIVQRFETIAAMHRDRLAVKMGDRALTYQELNRAANRIAWAVLDKLGSGNEPVALFFEHGIDVIVALLGVIKSGKFYVALDPSFPEERSRDILQDSGTKLIVTNGRHAPLAKAIAAGGAETLDILDIDGIDPNFSGDKPDVLITLADFAQMTYTSGSTGKPKGIAKRHGTVVAGQGLKTREVPVSAMDRWSLLHSVVVAAAGNALFQSLLNGAALLPFDVKAEGIPALARWLREEKITSLHVTPSLFRQVAEVLANEDKLPALRLIRLSGSPITRRDFELYKQVFTPRTMLQIHMGSAETGAIALALVDHSFIFPAEGAPVGYPIPGKKVFLLDDAGREVGPGEVGEIVVKTRHQNDQYWRSEELTKTKFIPDPAGGEEITCLTGDLGKFLPDGFLIHLGRKDFMVKIRGYRVEFGEIERALLEHPQVKEACVTAWEHEDGEKYLAAYVVARNGCQPAVDKLRRFIGEKLPDYMQPAVFTFMESLPLNNGKVMRASLPKPDAKRPELSESYAAPQNEIECALAEIWSQILSLDQVGIHDDFFDLGGHSLAATRVVSRIIEKFRLELPVKSLFESATIAAMARVIEAGHEPVSDKDLERLLAEIESMSEEEANDRLDGYRRDGR
jgi:amino acid adenylation domain-containing protein